jgi:hypothetical protein
VPYEIGFSRSAATPVFYLVLESIRAMESLPEYVRLGANFWSVDELVRWATRLSGNQARTPEPATIRRLADFVPRLPPAPTVQTLVEGAVTTINRLAESNTWTALKLSQTDTFNWLPTRGGIVRDLAYDLLAPLAFLELKPNGLITSDRELLHQAFQAPTLHYRLARADPTLPYTPQADYWRRLRYQNPPTYWLQGLSMEQLRDRLHRFLIVNNLDRQQRLATREEFKAEFDRILQVGTEYEQRALGVLINPLLGFTPIDRPVYWRVLALQHHAYNKIIGRDSITPFDPITATLTRQFVHLR